MITARTYEQYDRLLTSLDDVKTAVLSTHINPDGDGLGSELALAALLSARGISVSILNHDAVPPSYRFLDPDGSVLRRFGAERDAETVRTTDLFVIVDTNHPDRLGSVTGHARACTGKKAIIDHHPEPDSFADIVVSDTGACATGEIVFRLLEHAGTPEIDASLATALYAAIMTDTGSFRFPKTDGDVHRIVAGLIDAGADPAGTYALVYEHGRVNRLQLLGRVLSGLRVHQNGEVCVLTVTREMFRDTGTSELDTDMFVTYGLSISGVRVAVMISELPDVVKINVRSKGSVPANRIAKAFGGNGHLNAAGARIPHVPLEDLVPKILSATSTFLAEA